MVRTYTAGDYAGLEAGRYSFYYGYEAVDKDDNWLFIASVDGKEVMRTPIKQSSDGEPSSCLLEGIALFLEKASDVKKGAQP